jgi:hypothetical protein
VTRGQTFAIVGGVLAVGGLAGVAIYAHRRSVGIRVSPVGATDDVYALGRVLASEAATEPAVIREAIGRAVLNHARRLGRTIYATVAPNGWESQQGGGYVSTAREPRSTDLQLAAYVLTPGTMDVTGGAEYFDSPRAQRAALAKGIPGYRKTPEQVARDREAAGLVLVVLPGVDPERFRMWRRRGAGSAVS